ncbi:MAG: hypothetical protein H6738_11625 [Alphaproteobacteria bacterium]|nr:hypothetical protein [Alphaproteobacteria bacterium]MCB9697421.1 hypothetical protein [Alphaproteobacteria bacterium]
MILLPLLAGCDGGNNFTFSGSPVWETFPFDGERTWEFLSTDTSLAYKLIATSDQEPQVKDGANVYVVDYWTHCVGADPDCVEGESLRRIQWSSTVTDGVRIHGYAVGSGAINELSPPIHVATDVMKKEEVLTTATGGATWSSTLVGLENCPIKITADWDNCNVFEITSDTGDGYPIAGKYWTVGGNGFAAMEIVTDSGQWQLSDASCEPADECDGTW